MREPMNADAGREERTIEAGTLDIHTASQDGTCLVTLRGELDMASAPILEQELGRLLDTDVSRLVVDLGELEFLDSTGLSSLITVTTLARASGDKLRLLPGRGHVGRVMELTGMDNELPFTTRDSL